MTTTGSRSSGFWRSFGCRATWLMTGVSCFPGVFAANTVTSRNVSYPGIMTKHVQDETRLYFVKTPARVGNMSPELIRIQ